jgi:hypothetical protein
MSTLARTASLLLVVTAACGGTAASDSTTSTRGAPGSDGGHDTTSDGGAGASDAATAPDADPKVLACGKVDADYRAIATTAAYRTCTTAADCTIVSSDVCTFLPQLSVNAAGVAASQALKQQWHALGDCFVNDCGSGGGPGYTPGCPAGKCVALQADGGIYGN